MCSKTKKNKFFYNLGSNCAPQPEPQNKVGIDGDTVICVLDAVVLCNFTKETYLVFDTRYGMIREMWIDSGEYSSPPEDENYKDFVDDEWYHRLRKLKDMESITLRELWELTKSR